MPDEMTIPDFGGCGSPGVLGVAILEGIGKHLESHGFRLSNRTIMDAMIVGAPSSTKSNERARDPEIHSTKKGRQWCFGMNRHIGVTRRRG